MGLIEQIETKVKQTIQEYKLFTKRDKVAVAASGGKDSTSLLYILKRLNYDVSAINVDPNIGEFTKRNLENLRGFCSKEGIPLIEVSFRDAFGGSLCHLNSILESKGIKLNSCTVCGVLRRYLINWIALERGFDVVATGHNLDDEAEATLMNIFRNDTMRFFRQGPVVGVTTSPKFVQRVKPLYFCTELQMTEFSKALGLPVIYKRCPCALTSYRNQVRGFITQLEAINPSVREAIVRFALREIAKRDVKQEEIKVCDECGQPSSGGLCKTCQLLKTIRGDNHEGVSG